MLTIMRIQLCAFIKQIVFEFNKRKWIARPLYSHAHRLSTGWHEEQLPACKTPKHRRLTASMRRELVKFLRTPALLAMFSQDSTTVANIQSCLKSMSVMEPDLILIPVLERAFPALEAVVEVSVAMAPTRDSV
jgi:proteasome activator subunit 4